MPEGDTIFRSARALDRALAGKIVTRFETSYAHLASVDDDLKIAGCTVEHVEARGKWLLMFSRRFDFGDAYADEWFLASVSCGGALASATTRYAYRD